MKQNYELELRKKEIDQKYADAKALTANFRNHRISTSMSLG